MNYSTTSFHPSGNRYVPADYCHNSARNYASSLGRRIPVVSKETLPDDRGNAFSADWVVGGKAEAGLLVQGHSAANGVVYQHRFFHDKNTTSWRIVSFASKERPLVSPFLPLANNPIVALSNYSAAVPTPDGGILAIATIDADPPKYRVAQLNSQGEEVTHASLSPQNVVDALPDAHITYSHSNQMWAVHGRATNKHYVHGILGDDLEGYRIYLLGWNSETQRVEALEGPAISLKNETDAVFEQLGSMWLDVNGDGVDDLVTTVARSDEGSALRVYFLDYAKNNNSYSVLGTAQSGFIGQGGRWLHLLAAGGFAGSGNAQEIAEVRTPHIGGVVRFYRWDGASELKLVARTTDCSYTDAYCGQTYTSHLIDSRNTDQAIAADFNGDGIVELVLQTQDRKSLVGLQRCGENGNGVVEAWRVPLPGPVRSNIALWCGPNEEDSIDLVYGTDDSQLVRVSFVRDNTATPFDCRHARSGAVPAFGALHPWTMILFWLVAWRTKNHLF